MATDVTVGATAAGPSPTAPSRQLNTSVEALVDRPGHGLVAAPHATPPALLLQRRHTGRVRRPVAAPPAPPRSRWWMIASVAAVMVAFGVAVVLRFQATGPLWLDETISVQIAHRSVPGLLAALRHDGAPPLYYLLLHAWMAVFGDGEVAVRALSGVFSVVSIPVAWALGRRLAAHAAATAPVGASRVHPERVGLAAALLLAANPYAIRYATEGRMYSLVVLVVLLLGLALCRALARPGLRTAVPLALATAAVAYTHYWGFLMLAAVAGALAVAAVRLRDHRRRVLTALAAMTAAAVPFLPWAPTLLFQLKHTGTPWATPVQPQVLLTTVFDWSGPGWQGSLLFLLLLGAAVLGFTAVPAADGRNLLLSVRGRTPGRWLAVAWLVPLALAYALWRLTGSAFVPRYTAVALPAFLLLAALGLGSLPTMRARNLTLAVAVVAGLVGGHQENAGMRTQAGQVASMLVQLAHPGDVVVYCPDQIAPDTHRALVRHGLARKVHEMTFADSWGPELVDWVDYIPRLHNADGRAFAASADALAGPHGAVYLVTAGVYRGIGDGCGETIEYLTQHRGGALTVVRPWVRLEPATVLRFPQQTPATTGALPRVR